MIDPRGLSVTGWAARTLPLLSSFGPIPILDNDQNWQAWGRLVCSIPGIAALNPPRPDSFPSWTAWAFSFNQSLGLVVGGV